MKKLLLILGVLVSLAAARIVLPQVTEGVVTYEVKINMHRTIPKEREGMKGMVPEFRTSHQQLFFNANESLYQPILEDEDDADFNDGQVRMRFQQPHVEMYSNATTSRRIAQQEFMGKEYLIEDSLNLPPWKFGTETKTIMGYVCKQAMFFNEERKQNVVAWYAPQLRPFLGPDIFNTLPGGVLEVDINDGERVILAKNIEARTLKKNELKMPSKGIKISRAEFRKMLDEHTARMRANGANIIVRD
jgi:GLPGLI family protein